MGRAKPETVSADPLFAWFERDKRNRRLFVQAGYTDARITNWRKRGIPRAEIGPVAAMMGATYETYLQSAGEKNVAKQPVSSYASLSEESLEIARAFEQMQPQAREYIREQVFIYTVIDKSFPWLRHGRPIGRTYAEFEKWHQDNIETKHDFELQREGLRPRDMTEKTATQHVDDIRVREGGAQIHRTGKKLRRRS